jgi:hypothetical protein
MRDFYPLKIGEHDDSNSSLISATTITNKYLPQTILENKHAISTCLLGGDAV